MKGAPELIEMFKESVETHGLQNDVTLAGCFCSGQCNRQGVTIIVDDEVCTGITRDNFKDFFDEKILAVLSER